MYAKDGIHPSPYGTYLEACVIASAVTGETVKPFAFTYSPAGDQFRTPKASNAEEFEKGTPLDKDECACRLQNKWIDSQPFGAARGLVGFSAGRCR